MPDQRDTTCRPSLTACPISLGRVTRMSEGAFRSLCERYQRQQRDQRRQPTGVSPIYGRCATCKGRHLPAELSIISEGEVMAMTKKKASQVEALGDAAVLNALEKELGCGPGEDVLTRARLMKEELDKVKAAGAAKDKAGQALMDDVAMVRSLLSAFDDTAETLPEMAKAVTSKLDALYEQYNELRKISGEAEQMEERSKARLAAIVQMSGRPSWDAITAEVQRLLDDREARLIKAEATAEELEGRLEEVRATLAEIERIVDPDGNNSLMLTEQIEDLVMRRIPAPEPNTDALTDFARRVLRGEVSLIYHERQ